MVVYCTVCTNNTRKNKNISYFNYPKECNRRHGWLQAVGREDLLLKLFIDKTRQQHRICEEHFEKKFIKFSKNGSVKYLLDFAFPTLKLQSNEGASLSSIQENTCPTVNSPSNTGADLNQFEYIAIQEHRETHLLPTSKVTSNSKNVLNNEVILEDHTSHSIQTESDMLCTNRSAETALHLSANTPRDVVRSRWNNLQDSYGKHLRASKGEAGKHLNRYKSWPWINQMSFLQPFLDVSGTQSSLNSSSIEIENYICPSSGSSGPVFQQPTTSPTTEPQHSHIPTYNQNNELEIDNYLNKRFKTEYDDTDLIFLGYSKTIKKMSLQRQASVKFNIARVIMEAELEHAEEISSYEPGDSPSDIDTDVKPIV